MTRRDGAEILVATDGSCLKNPGGAIGWAWVAQDGRWSAGCAPEGTNQIAELWAVLAVLRDFPQQPLAIQIDSEYAMKVATSWAPRWQRNGWRTASGAPVSNLDLVKGIHLQTTRRRRDGISTRFIKVPGHDKANRWPLNTAADARAGEAARYARRTGRSDQFLQDVLSGLPAADGAIHFDKEATVLP